MKPQENFAFQFMSLDHSPLLLEHFVESFLEALN